MTRLYGFEFTCESCHRSGPFGWVYRCTQDREDLIEHAVEHNQLVQNGFKPGRLASANKHAGRFRRVRRAFGVADECQGQESSITVRQTELP